MEVPQIIQVIGAWLSIETHGDLGIPQFHRSPKHRSTSDVGHVVLSQLDSPGNFRLYTAWEWGRNSDSQKML